MLAMTLSAALEGLTARLVRVEVDVQRGIPSFELVGLAEAAVRESRFRVKSALSQLGVQVQEHRVVVNLGPADLRKFGSGFDLAIAVATLAALGKIPSENLERIVFLGELSLSGRVHAVRGVLPTLIGLRGQINDAIVPLGNECEASLVRGIQIACAEDLPSVLSHLTSESSLAKPRAQESGEVSTLVEDLVDVRGQAHAKRALEIAAAGGHNLLLVGPPGAGKTMLARRAIGLLPELAEDERLDVMALRSVAGLLLRDSANVTRPFRAPHHTASDVALVGGGEPVRPGEVSLAHRGVLFLDELPEFRRSAIEALRQPLEDGWVTVSRARSKATFPSRPIVICAMNPCPCGYHGSTTRTCECSVERRRTYRARISGPLLDRIDLHVSVSEPRGGARVSSGDSTSVVRARVESARRVQWRRRSDGLAATMVNAELTARDVAAVCKLRPDSERWMDSTCLRLGLSLRAAHKVLKVARTIADLEQASDIGQEHLAEAIASRVLDRTTAPPTLG